jgi:hypothetical protein
VNLLVVMVRRRTFTIVSTRSLARWSAVLAASAGLVAVPIDDAYA